MTKRVITPHKGGRDSSLSIRISTEEKERLKALVKVMNISMADYIMSCVERDEKAIEKTN